MTNIYRILFLLFLVLGCNSQKPNYQKTVNQYYSAFDSGNFNKIKGLVNDSITIVSGDYVTSYTHKSFYEFFKWDSIFKSSYKVLELEEKNNHVVATVSQNNIRNKYLKNNPLVFQVKVSFSSGKISKLVELEYIEVDWKSWTEERDSLVSWIANNHPKLDGFVNDMTMKGAQDYLSAIDLYTTHKESRFKK